MSIFNKIGIRIIKQQEQIIGPVAWTEAKKVPGLSVVSQESGEISFTADEKETVNKLVSQYERLFGRASREACRESVQDLLAELPRDQIPVSLA
ncbi:MAG TPA: hypothetical protein PK950_01550 [Candidatus Paceibacterota bacterium]|nr:hypothetical protein [Candidatus Paceibacterota bacterium]